MTYSIAAFYRFTPVADPPAVRAELQALAEVHGLCGTILIAPEGLNATVAAPPAQMAHFTSVLRRDVLGGRLADMSITWSESKAQPFQRLKVRLKEEIVTLRAPEADPARDVGTYVAPEDWNALITAPDVTVIDVRNDYEVAIGTFAGATDPETASFTAFKAFVDARLDPERDRRVATFCTGGIRCEKATAYLKARGFREVYHLEGGILRYLEQVAPNESLWQGACFVFDERVAVGHGLCPTEHVICQACGWPVAPDAPQRCGCGPAEA